MTDTPAPPDRLPDRHSDRLPDQLPDRLPDLPPDSLSDDPHSPHHDAAVFERDVGVRINGKERFDVQEYCVSEGWIKIPAGKAVDRRGQPLLIKLKGTVEVFCRSPAAG